MDASMNLAEVSIGMMINLIKEQIEDELFATPMLFLGKSGIGKTEAVMELVKTMNSSRKKEQQIGFKEFRLILTNEVDLMGTPTIDKEADGSQWSSFATPKTMPDAKRDGEYGILLFDEITSATANVRTAAMQLMDKSRSLGNYKLPPKWLIICLGNGEEDGGNFNGMEFAFLNRCISYRVRTEVDCTDPVKGLGWVQWAMQNNVNPAVISFIKEKGMEALHKFDTDSPAAAFPSPRSWTLLSRKLNLQEQKNGGKPINDSAVAIYSAGFIGKSMSIEFTAHYRFKEQLANPKDILTKKVSYEQAFGGKTRSIALMQYTSMVNFLLDELRDDLEVFTIDKLDPETGQLKLTKDNPKYLENLFDIMLTLSRPEDCLYIFSNLAVAYGGRIRNCLESIPTYRKFKDTEQFKYINNMSNMVK